MSHLPTILSIETSSECGSVALYAGEQTAIHRFEAPHRQAAELIPTVEKLLNDKGVWYDNLTDLCACIGPGSFTGIRIGLAAARMIAFSKPSLTTHCFTSLEAMERPQDKVLAVMRAGKGQLYFQQLPNSDMPTLENPAAALALNLHIIGHDDGLLEGKISHALPDAATMIKAVLAGKLPPKRSLSPLHHVRPPDAKLPQKAPF